MFEASKVPKVREEDPFNVYFLSLIVRTQEEVDAVPPSSAGNVQRLIDRLKHLHLAAPLLHRV